MASQLNRIQLAHLLFSPGQVNQVSGSTGCNRLTGTAILSAESTIRFSPMATTRMACMGANIETPFLAALGKVSDWRIAGKQLLLYAGDILLAKFNSETVAASPGASKLNGSWELNYISGPRIAFDGLYPNKKPVLVFDLPKSEVSGHTSCNPFSAPFTIDGQKISFGDGRSTMMACEGIGEPTFLKTLKQVTSYAVSEDNVFTLIMGDVAMMRFVKK